MKNDRQFKLEILSNIADEIIGLCTAQRAKLLLRVRAGQKRTKRITLITATAASLVLILTLVTLLPHLLSSMNGKQVPIYRGMTVSKTEPTQAHLPEGNLFDFLSLERSKIRPLTASIGLLNSTGNGNHGNNGNNGNHYGNDKNPGDKETSEVTETEKPPHDFAPTPQSPLYYASQNEDFYITIHIDNPDDFEIVSFTLNGVKYSSYMFEQGSNMENLILKCNVGDAEGIVDYTIDAIKYIDGETIKDVIIEGDQTVRVAIHLTNQPTARISSSIDSVSANFTISYTDPENILKDTGAKLYALLKKGTVEVARRDLTLSDTSIVFDGLMDDASYTFLLYAVYDSYDGQGETDHLLATKSFEIEKIVSLSFENYYPAKEFVRVDLKVTDPLNLPKQITVTLSENGQVLETITRTDGGTIIFDGLSVLRSFTIDAECTYTLPNESGTNTASKTLDVVTQSEGLQFELAFESPPTVAGIGSCTDTVLYINMDVMSGCIQNVASITAVIFGTSGSISLGNFDGCDSLEYIFIPKEAEFLHLYPPCPILTDCPDESSMPRWWDTSIENVIWNVKTVERDAQGILYAVLNDGGKALISYNERNADLVIPEGVAVIPNGFFEHNDYITSIVLPDSLTKIGDWAFANCRGLETIVFGSRLKSIGSYAFQGCGSLRTLVLPDGLTEIGEGAFDGCPSLQSIVLPDSLTSLANCIFSGCSSMTQVTLPSNLKSIGDYAFYDCQYLREIYLPEGLTSIGEQAFGGCYNLTSIVLPESVDNMGDDAFLDAGLTIYVRAAERPNGWSRYWISSLQEHQVVWGYTGE